ncbi:hypothetical protein E4U53_005747 [Claviceps sorghi]|nr:hypothetical protein E4U53_005747 [Claviceps sorghi]
MDIFCLPHLHTSFTNTRSKVQTTTRSTPKEQSRFRGSDWSPSVAECARSRGNPHLGEPASGTLQAPATIPEDFILRPNKKIAADQNEQHETVLGSSSGVMPLSEQHNTAVVNVSTSMAAPPPKVPYNIQTGNLSNASSPTVTERVTTRNEAQLLAERPPPLRQNSEPSRVQAAPFIPPNTHAAVHPTSMVPPVRVISSDDLLQQVQPNPAMPAASTQVPTQAPAQAPAQNLFTIWRQTIFEHLARLERTGTQISSLERWRYKKLAEACEHGDLLYLNFHRLLCRWSIFPEHPLAIQISNPNLNAALITLQEYLRPATEIQLDHLSWFMQFPWNPFCPSSLFVFNNDHNQAVIEFLKPFAQKWNVMLDLVAQRHYPLLVHELLSELKCPSEVLSVSLFLASCSRLLDLSDKGNTAKMSAIFHIDKRNEMLAISSMLDQRDLDRQRQNVIAQYRGAINDGDPHQSRNHASAPFLPSTRVPFSTSVSYQQNNAFVTATAHSSNPNLYAGARTQPNSQLLYQPAVSIAPSGNAGNSLLPHAERLNHQNGRMLPASARVQIRTPPTNTMYLSSPSAVSTSQSHKTPVSLSGPSDRQDPGLLSPRPSQIRARCLHTRPNPRPQNIPSSVSTTPPVLTPSRPQVNENRRYSTEPLLPTQYPHSAWMSVQYGLHLVRSRSPDRTNSSGAGTRYYQFLSHFAVEPTPILPQKGVQRFEFTVNADEFRLRSELKCTEDTITHHFKNGSRRYRLRLVKRDQKSLVIDNTSWVTSSSIWPAEIYMLFNDEPVYPRRGQHFRHDLPTELTDLLQEGLNTIRVSLPRSNSFCAETLSYYLAVEVIVTMDHASTLDMIFKKEKIGADQTRLEIQRRMQHTVSDDVIINDDSLSISVTDPFSFSMFQVPVRGVACKHIECFDLQTWLQTRPSKEDSRSQSEPSLVDRWRCPICNGDAAPPSLRIDEFLLEVQQALTLAGKRQTRSISAYLDGSWIANEEKRDDNHDGNEDQNNKDSSRPSLAPRREPQIIEILDD